MFIVQGKVPYGAGVVEAINIYCGRSHIPVGAYYGDDIGDPLDKMNAEKLAKNKTTFGNTIVHNRDAEEMTQLTRTLLTEQEDDSVILYNRRGTPKGFYDLLVSRPDAISPHDGTTLVRKKIHRWVALGALGANDKKGHYGKDWNFFFNGTAPYTKYLVENFPKPIFYVTGGTDVMTGRTLKTTPPGNILRDAYRQWLWNFSRKTLDDQRPSWDLVAVYFAVEGVGDYLVEERNGMMDFDIEKGCRWIQSGRETAQTFVRQRKNINQSFSNYLNQMIVRPVQTP